MSDELTGMQKLQAIQQELKAPKGQTNTFGGYKYRSCEDILEAVKPLLKKHGLVLVVSDNLKELCGSVFVDANASVAQQEDGEVIAVAHGFARHAEQKKGMDDAQITGACSSYARKYALNGLFLIDDVKDADSTNKHGKDKPNRTPVKELPEWAKELTAKSKVQIKTLKWKAEECEAHWNSLQDGEVSQADQFAVLVNELAEGAK